MSEPAARRAILASRSVDRPGEIDRLNDILADAGLGRPLEPPERNTPTVSVLPVSGEVDLHRIVDTLRQATPVAGELYPQVFSGYRVHTVSDNAPDEALVATVPLLAASGLKSGHGTVFWTPVPAADMPPAPPWPPAGSRPVVVVIAIAGDDKKATISVCLRLARIGELMPAMRRAFCGEPFILCIGQ